MDFHYGVFLIARAEHELRIHRGTTERRRLHILDDARNRRLAEIRSNVQRYLRSAFNTIIVRLRQATSLRPA